MFDNHRTIAQVSISLYCQEVKDLIQVSSHRGVRCLQLLEHFWFWVQQFFVLVVSCGQVQAGCLELELHLLKVALEFQLSPSHALTEC